MQITIKKGLDLPLTGSPEQRIEDGPDIARVAVLGGDYVGMKPTMLVAEGDRVSLGQPLFEDKKNPGVQYTAPAAGEIEAINRGARRVLQSVVIRVDGDAAEAFTAHDDADIDAGLDPLTVREQLIASGLWTALRTRPYSKVPAVDANPAALFVTAIDTNFGAPDPAVVIADDPASFERGLKVLSALVNRKIWLCTRPGAQIPQPQLAQLERAEFAGPHPAGLPGTHIHFLEPVGMGRSVWYINYQDVMMVGRLFATGRIDPRRVIALSGPEVDRPRLLRTRLGACTDEIIAGAIDTSVECRVISGPVLSGRRAAGWGRFVSRYHNQITVLREGREREFMGWVAPGINKYSANNVFLSALKRASQRFAMTTTQNGSPRAMVPIGNYERVVPLDTLPTQLLRALLVKDTDSAQALGCLELDEEDLALCSFVCVGKYDYGPYLRANLEQIEKEG